MNLRLQINDIAMIPSKHRYVCFYSPSLNVRHTTQNKSISGDQINFISTGKIMVAIAKYFSNCLSYCFHLLFQLFQVVILSFRRACLTDLYSIQYLICLEWQVYLIQLIKNGTYLAKYHSSCQFGGILTC